MKKLHALGAAVIGVTLSASAALAAVPHDQAQPETAEPTLASNHGSLVSTVAAPGSTISLPVTCPLVSARTRG
jgi:hypothetical protein